MKNKLLLQLLFSIYLFSYSVYFVKFRNLFNSSSVGLFDVGSDIRWYCRRTTAQGKRARSRRDGW